MRLRCLVTGASIRLVGDEADSGVTPDAIVQGGAEAHCGLSVQYRRRIQYVKYLVASVTYLSTYSATAVPIRGSEQYLTTCQSSVNQTPAYRLTQIH